MLESTLMSSSATRPVPRRVPREKSSLPAIVLLAGWLIPGLGHVLVGKYIRAALLFVSIFCMYVIGLHCNGKMYTPASGDILDILGFIGQLGMGILYALARMMNWGAASAVNTVADYGSKFLLCTGLLNFIAAVDAHSLANGRKASN